VAGVDTVESEVRELVRRRGLDPSPTEPPSAASSRGVTEYDERALSSSLAPLADPLTAARSVYAAVAGFGPLLRHLDDPEIEEGWINERLTWGWAGLTQQRPAAPTPASAHSRLVSSRHVAGGGASARCLHSR
jgi:hypothetical protein